MVSCGRPPAGWCPAGRLRASAGPGSTARAAGPHQGVHFDKLRSGGAAASSVQPALTTGGAPAECYGVARNTAVAAVVLY